MAEVSHLESTTYLIIYPKDRRSEFAGKDPNLNQITTILFASKLDYILRYDRNRSKRTEIVTKQDIANLERRFLTRINYGALDVLRLKVVDPIGLHSAILRHLTDKHPRIKFLELAYEGPASAVLLGRLVQQNVINYMYMHGGWPPERTTPLVEALIPQRQLRKLHCCVRMHLSESCLTSFVANWCEDNSPEEKDVTIWGLQTLPLNNGVYRHMNLKDQLYVDVNSRYTRLKFSHFIDCNVKFLVRRYVKW
uniref:FBA_2 domain-containing protein n=1 Tax=Steinernema glaseri TaxID=37863 RepID=A0A1I7Y186_9BILA